MTAFNQNAATGRISNTRTAAGLLWVLAAILSLTGCGHLVSSAMDDVADGITRAVTDSDDLETVKTGLPAYLLMVDGLVQNDPENDSLLRAAAALNGAYSGMFAEDAQRRHRMTDKALDYGFRAICLRRIQFCDVRGERFDVFEQAVASTDRGDVPNLFALGSAWAGWIQARSGDIEAIAQLPHVEAIMKRVVVLDEGYKGGEAHIYLGVLAALIPPAAGGQPDVARGHFERAIELSEGKNLLAKVLYAERYARMVFDRALHDRLLQEVLAADPNRPGYTLSNVFAQQRARTLLQSAGDYF